ncbi:MAG: hypothetical protein WA417_00575 [Stellaceae bacterium]|jgi:hypothetical protein
MDKKIAGLLGAAAGLATMSTAQAAINPAPLSSKALGASSYADLLAPIPDAVALLDADNAARAQKSPEPAADDIEVAQYYSYTYPYPPYAYHHHHHHHHRYYRRYSHHHHHHHHHNSTFVGIPGVGGVVVGR